MADPDPELLSQKALAARFGVSVSTIRLWRSLDRIPAPTSLGYWSWTVILAWLAEDQAEATERRHPKSRIAMAVRRAMGRVVKGALKSRSQ